MIDIKIYMLQRYHARRQQGIEQLGGKCLKCAATENLHFHHRNPKEKSFTVGSGGSFSEERWQQELAKCDLLCRDCHIVEHKPAHVHGDVRRYWQGCKCAECRAANTAHSRRYKRSRG